MYSCVTHLVVISGIVNNCFIMVLLTTFEKTEIVEIFQNFSLENTAQIFNERHPDRQPPLHPRTVKRIWDKLMATGSVERKKRKKVVTLSTDPNVIERTLMLFEEEPHLSTRAAARQSNISHSTVQKILKKNLYFPYKLQTHQKLLHGDPRARVNFCRRFLEEVAEDDDFKREK